MNGVPTYMHLVVAQKLDLGHIGTAAVSRYIGQYQWSCAAHLCQVNLAGYVEVMR